MNLLRYLLIVAFTLTPLPNVAGGWLPMAGAGSGGGGTTTFNPSDLANGTLSTDHLTFTETGASDGGSRSISSHSTGKFYIEYIASNFGSNPDTGVGISNSTPTFIQIAGSALNSVILYKSGNLWINGSNAQPSDTALWNPTQTVGMAVDLGAQLIWFEVSNGVWNPGVGGSPNPATGVGGVSFAAITGPYFPAVTGTGGGSDILTANFGAGGCGSFTFTSPTGFTCGWP